jgi:hypothetical protein
MKKLAQTKVELNAATALDYITGTTTNAPTIKAFGDVVALGVAANVAMTLANDRASRLTGGMQALSVAAVLTAQHFLDCGKGKTLHGAANALQEAGWIYGNTEASAKSIKSLCVRLGESLLFHPAVTSDAAAVFAEALGLVREAMTQHGTVTAWIKATPPASKREPRPEGNAAPGRPAKEVEPDTDETNSPSLPGAKANTFDVYAAAQRLVTDLAERASRGDVSALEHLRDLVSEAMNAFDAAEAAAKIKSTKRPRKAA